LRPRNERLPTRQNQLPETDEMNWIDKEVDRLEEDLSSGLITDKEYDQGMREIRAELEGQADDAAADAYNDVMGGNW